MARNRDSGSPSERGRAAGRARIPRRYEHFPEAEGGVRFWQPRWEGFLAAHRAWWGRVAGEGPVYWLPEPVVQALTLARAASGPEHRQRRSLLSSTFALF